MTGLCSPRKPSGVVLLLALLLSASVALIAAEQLAVGAVERQERIEAQVTSIGFFTQAWRHTYTDAVRVAHAETNQGEEDESTVFLNHVRQRFNGGLNGTEGTEFMNSEHGFAVTPESLGYSAGGMMTDEECSRRGTACWGAWIEEGQPDWVHLFVHFRNEVALRPVFQRLLRDAVAERLMLCAVTPGELRYLLQDVTRGSGKKVWNFSSVGTSAEDTGATCSPSASVQDIQQFLQDSPAQYPGSVLLGRYQLSVVQPYTSDTVLVTAGGHRSNTTLELDSIALRKLAGDQLEFASIDQKGGTYEANTYQDNGRFSVYGRDVVRIRRRNDAVEPEDARVTAREPATRDYNFAARQTDPPDLRTYPNIPGVDRKASCYAIPYPLLGPPQLPGQTWGYSHVNEDLSLDDPYRYKPDLRFRPLTCPGSSGFNGQSRNSRSAPSSAWQKHERKWKPIKWRYVIAGVGGDLYDDAANKPIAELTEADLLSEDYLPSFPGRYDISVPSRSRFAIVDKATDKRYIWPLGDRNGGGNSRSAAYGMLGATAIYPYVSHNFLSLGLPPSRIMEDYLTYINTLTGANVYSYWNGAYRLFDRNIANIRKTDHHWPRIERAIQAWRFDADDREWKTDHRIWPLRRPDGRHRANNYRDKELDYYLHSSYLFPVSVMRHAAHQLFVPGVKRRPPVKSGLTSRRGSPAGGNRATSGDYYLDIYKTYRGRGVVSYGRRAHWLPKLKGDHKHTDDYKDVTKIFGGATAARMKIDRLYGAIHLRPDFMRKYLEGSPAEDLNWDWDGSCDELGDVSTLVYDPMNPDPRLLYSDRESGDTLDLPTRRAGREVRLHPDCPTYLRLADNAVIFSEAIIFDDSTGGAGSRLDVAFDSGVKRLEELWPASFHRAGTASLQAIRPYSYRAAFPGSRLQLDSGEDIGFLAQEVQAYYPDAVFEYEGLLSVGYYSLLPALWSHLQQARSRHEKRMADMSRRMANLRRLLTGAGDCSAAAEPHSAELQEEEVLCR